MSKLSLSLSDISKTVQLIISKIDINADYKKEIHAVNDNPIKVSNSEE
jgi:hypothetical protein